ncbi:MAG: hypothetical protein ACRDKS_07965 [Actinomycetota bacterium]
MSSMPQSKGRKRKAPRPTPELEAEARARRIRREDFRRRMGWTLAIIGGALFLIGQIGSRTGALSLPFDRHHLISQVGGFFLLIRGLTWGWR